MTTQDSTRQLMSRTRLETFSDGVIAIAITLTVLSIGVPRGLPRSRVGSAILDLIPELGIYLLSFAVIGLFWMSHHFALDRIERIDRRIMLLNLAFLACISLMPLVTDLMNQYPVSPAVMTYAAVMTLAALSELAIWLHAERHGLVAEEVTQEDRRAGDDEDAGGASGPASRATLDLPSGMGLARCSSAKPGVR